MANDFKKLNQQLKRQNKQKIAGKRIPPQVANVPTGLNNHFGEKFRLIFQYYNHAECEMVKMTKDEMKRVMNTFTKITQYDQSNISKLTRPNPVKRVGASASYKNLFNTLPADFDYLLEVDFMGSGRIFIYPYQNMCCVVAVDKKHR